MKHKATDWRAAYSELEPDICDLWRQARTVFQFEVADPNEELRLLAINHMETMTKNLKEKFYRLWDEAAKANTKAAA